MDVVNKLYPSEQQMAMLQSDNDERPLQLVNLFKFKDKAEYSDGRETSLSGKEAYDLYGRPMLDVLAKFGAEVVFFSEMTGLIIGEVEEMWDAMAIVRYPSRQVLLDMTSSPEFKELSVHREAGLAGQLNIETRIPE